MLRIRIFAAAAALVLTALLSQAAAAQTSAGKPLALLAGLKPPHETKAVVAHHKIHKRIAARKSRTRLPTGKRQELAAQPAEPQAPALSMTTAPPADSAPAADSVPPPDAAQNENSNQIVVAGQTVQIAAPDQANAIDLAADDHHDSASAVLRGDRADAADAAATPTVLAAPVHEQNNAVGSASWIAQVLAALGGAIAAGTVAWFLIGSGPQRTYG